MTTFSLQDQDLFRRQAYIGGRWCDSDSGATLEVNNPATGEVLGTVPMMGANETGVQSRRRRTPLLTGAANLPRNEAFFLRCWHDLIMANVEDLGKLMTAEQGKPVGEAMGEVAYAASFIEWFAEEAKRVYGDTIPSPWNDRRLVVIKQPIGVCAAMTPWNFPAAMITRKAGPALASGCTMVAR
jgi:succinate-semialdehyde dehydrogenase/glutarate-semialdehyde dehydrogenase